VEQEVMETVGTAVKYKTELINKKGVYYMIDIDEMIFGDEYHVHSTK